MSAGRDLNESPLEPAQRRGGAQVSRDTKIIAACFVVAFVTMALAVLLP